MMRNEYHLNQTLNYIHYNPVKHGYIKDIYEWPWSSLYMYEHEKGREWLKENWEKYKPAADFGKDWDM
jgi:putative transposase